MCFHEFAAELPEAVSGLGRSRSIGWCSTAEKKYLSECIDTGLMRPIRSRVSFPCILRFLLRTQSGIHCGCAEAVPTMPQFYDSNLYGLPTKVVTLWPGRVVAKRPPETGICACGERSSDDEVTQGVIPDGAVL